MSTITDINKIKLVVGLGNPGQEYEKTRHNAGQWFLNKLAQKLDFTFKSEARFKCNLAKVMISGYDRVFAIPHTFMNHSGQTVGLLARFYKIKPEEILVAHDELDLSPGTVKLKFSGGHGGHNGLRDIINQLGQPTFYRLRIGIGHPGDSKLVSNYVLKKPTDEENNLIQIGIEKGLCVFEDILHGAFEKAMNELHRA